MATRSKIVKRIGAVIVGLSIVATTLGESSTFYEFIRKQFPEEQKPPTPGPSQTVTSESKSNKDLGLRMRFDERYTEMPFMDAPIMFSAEELTFGVDWTTHSKKRRKVHPSEYA
jgi:hypothetical protein